MKKMEQYIHQPAGKVAILSILLLSATSFLFAQRGDDLITTSQVEQIERILASDSLQGRGIYTAGIEKAADFIAAQFRTIGLSNWDTDTTYRQLFTADTSNRQLSNIIGVLPGKSRKEEYVIFSAHYDHLGIAASAVNGDSIYNGANDDAAGTTAVIMLAKYFKALGNNERTLIFVAFTAEESGGFGSQYFSRQIDPTKVVAMFNIEMIGTESKWGKNSAYITGYQKTNLGTILEKNLSGSDIRFYPDPYPEQQLFYRSDNATLARLGVPAHTISTSKMDNEPFYHTVRDQLETLDMNNMTHIIQGIALSAKTIISGEDTPSRVDAAGL